MSYSHIPISLTTRCAVENDSPKLRCILELKVIDVASTIELYHIDNKFIKDLTTPQVESSTDLVGSYAIRGAFHTEIHVMKLPNYERSIASIIIPNYLADKLATQLSSDMSKYCTVSS